MIVEIKGVEFANKGAHLMLVSIVVRLKEMWPEVQIALKPSTTMSRRQIAGVPALCKLNLRKHYVDLNRLSYRLPRALRSGLLWRFGVTEADVDLVVDASGFSYSDQWPSEIRIYHLRNELLRFHKHRKPYIFLPQAFGPFSLAHSAACIAQSFPYAAMICARDAQSYAYIETLTGALPHLFEYGDFTNLLDAVYPKEIVIEPRAACIVPNCNMLDPRNCNAAWLGRYEDLLLAAICYYREIGLRPFFLNQGGERDALLMARLNSQLEARDELALVVLEQDDPAVIKGIIGASAAVFCSRYHGCVGALSTGIACIGTSWSHKYEALYEQYGACELLLSPEVSIDECRAIIDLSLQNQTPLKQRIKKNALAQKRNATAMWAQFRSVLDGYPLFGNAATGPQSSTARQAGNGLQS
ncbi:polysaccharide pyruvyl transferase family protein [Porticoccaceae bacterium]|nr:polysaccharide pyruvyl transferase family protein [Porticoccaceae bacterium]